MRLKNKHILWMVLFLTAAFLSHCVRMTGKVDAAAVQDILAKINQAPLSVTIAAEDPHIHIEPEDRNTFRITLDYPHLSINPEIYQSLGFPMPEFTIPVSVNRIQLLYAPSLNYLAAGSAGPLVMTFDSADLGTAFPGGEKTEEPARMIFSYEIEEMTGGFVDISPVLDYSDEDAAALLADILKLNQEYGLQAKGLTMKMEGEEEEPFSRFTWTSGMIESRYEAAPEFISAFFDPLEEKGAFELYLKENKPLFDMNFRMDDSRFVFSSGENSVSAAVKAAGGTYYLRPEKDSQFNYGFSWNIEGAEISGGEIPDWAKGFAEINRMDFRFNISGLPPDLIEGYFEIMQLLRRSLSGKETLEGWQGRLAMQGLALVGKLTKAQPVITFHLVPLEWSAGEIQSEGEFKFIGMAPPVGKATVMIADLEGTAEKIRKVPGLPKESVEEMLTWVRTVFDEKETGEAVLVFEIREGEPGRFYLNGQLHKF
jgi:hypothetical protein